MNTPSARFLTTALTLALFPAITAFSQAASLSDGPSLPSGGVSLIGSSDPIDTMTFREKPTMGGEVIARRSIVPVADRPFDRAFRIEVFNPGKRFYDANIGAVGEIPVRKGDVALVRFQLRKIQSDDESGLVAVNVYVEGPGPAYSKSINTAVSAGDEWREFYLPFHFNDDYPAGQVFLFLSFGQTGKPMTMEIGGVELIHFGDRRSISELPRTRVTYAGSEPDAPWRKEADTRIEAYRKGDFSIHIIDTSGNPIEGAAVRVEMLRHAFKFASVAQSARIMGTTEDDRIYREKLLELFNASGPENDTKWGAWAGEWGEVGTYSQSQTLDALSWMSNHDLFLRGHVLVWPGKRNLPRLINDLLPDRDPSVPEMVLEHIDEVTQATKPFINEWDVLNEPYDNHDLMDIYGKDIMIDWFNRARANLPTAELYLNDYAILSDRGRNTEHQQHLEDTLHYLIDHGAPVTGIGMQGHIGEAPTEPTQLWKVLDRFATAFPELKIMITEFDLNTTDEDFQADYTRDFMTMVFSHPKVESIQNWGFWEGAHWLPNAAFYRRDWSEKPNLLAYRDLVFNKWWTLETGVTGSDGEFTGRGFLGRHRVTVTLGNQTAEAEFELTREMGEVTVVLPNE